MSEEEKKAFDQALADVKSIFNEESAKSVEAIKTATKEEIQSGMEAVKADVKDWIKQETELMKKGLGVYQVDVKEKRKTINKGFRALMKALVLNDDASLKEMTTDASGSPYAGYVVDSELSAEIRHLMGEYGVARQEMTVMTLSKGSYKANELATDLVVYWVDEGSAIKSTQIVIGQNSLELKKLATIVALTRELIEDEEFDLFSFIGTRVAENFAEAEDEFVFNGDGTSTYGSFTGLLNLTTTVNVVTMTGTTFASATFDNLLDMITATPKVARRNGKFYMNSGVMNSFRKKKDDESRYIFQEASVGGPVTIWGKPVVEVEVMPEMADTGANTAFAIFGDLRMGCIFGEKGGMIAEQFTSGTVRNVADSADINLLTTDRKAMRFIERVGYFQVITTFRKPITILKTASASA